MADVQTRRPSRGTAPIKRVFPTRLTPNLPGRKRKRKRKMGMKSSRRQSQNQNTKKKTTTRLPVPKPRTRKRKKKKKKTAPAPAQTATVNSASTTTCPSANTRASRTSSPLVSVRFLALLSRSLSLHPFIPLPIYIHNPISTR